MIWRVWKDGAWREVTLHPLAAGTAPGEVLTAMERSIRDVFPTTFAATYDIGPGKTYSTIGAALTAAQTTHNAAVPGSGTNTTPYRRSLFRVWPGEYYEYKLALPTHSALMGMGSTPDEVRIWHDVAHLAGGNIITTTGRSLYLSNVWLDHANPDPEHHGIRDAGASGDVGLADYQRRTLIFDRVHMSSDPLGLAGKTAFDATPSGVDIIFNRVHFDTPGQPQSVGIAVNYRRTTKDIPTRMFFYGCSVTTAHDWYEDPTLPNNGYYSDGVSVPGAVPIGLHDRASGGRDETWWVEGPESVWDVIYSGKYSEPPRSNIFVVKTEADIAASNGIYHIDPALPAPVPGAPALGIRIPEGVVADPMEPYTTRGGLVDRVIPATLPLAITDGVSADESVYYGPNPDTTPGPARVALTVSPTTVTLTAGRVYFIGIPTPEVMIVLGKIGHALTAGGASAFAHSYGIPTGTGTTVHVAVPKSPPTPYSTVAGQMTRTGQVTLSGAADVSVTKRWFFPGHGYIWLAVGCAQAATGTGAVKTAGDGVHVYYADGYTGGSLTDMPTLIPLPDGQPYPLLEAVNTYVP